MGLLRSIFHRFDEDGDGEITRDELRRGLRLQGVDYTDADFDVVANRAGTKRLLCARRGACS